MSGSRKGKKRIAGLTALLLAASLLGGCAGEGSGEEDNMILLVETEEDTTVTGVAVAARQDVSKTLKILLEYKATKSEELAFSLDRQEVEEVLVEEGDYVQKGDVLAKLTTEDNSSEAETMEYTIARLELQLEAVEREKALDIRDEEFEYAVGNHDKSLYESRMKAIEENYASTIQGYEDSLYINRMKLEQMEKSDDRKVLTAGMAGLVTYVQTGLKGSMTTAGQTVITIQDTEECYFFADVPEYREYFSEGDTAELVINTGVNKGTYLMTPVLEEGGEELYFTFAEGRAVGNGITVGTRASITLDLESRENVVAVPSRCIHKAGDLVYVYVVNEAGDRVTRYVEIGLEGDTYTEILSGLSEGEKVIQL